MLRLVVILLMMLSVSLLTSCSHLIESREAEPHRAKFSRGPQVGTGQTRADWQKDLEHIRKFAAPRKRTLVLPFWNDTPIKERFALGAQKAVKRAYYDSKQVNLVRDVGLDKESKDFYLDQDRIDLANLIRFGQKWGVSLVFMGRISRIVFRKAEEDVGLLRPGATQAAVYLDIRMIDVHSGKVAAKTETVGLGKTSTLSLLGNNAEDNRQERIELVQLAIMDGVKRALPVMDREIYRVTWRGRVAKITGRRFYINAGQATGLNLGDILKVMTAGTDIFDPETGLFIGKTEGEVKGTLEIIDFFGEDGTIGRVHSGGNFMENDVVLLY